MTEQPANVALREPANQVAPLAPVLWAAGALPGVGLLFAGLVAGDAFGWFDVATFVFPAYGVLALGYLIAMPVIRYRVHRWENTETAVYTQTGWLSRERRIAPMSRVQTVDFDQSAVGRLLGLASVTVTTASAAGPLRVSALDEKVALRLVDELTRRAEAEQSDAT